MNENSDKKQPSSSTSVNDVSEVEEKEVEPFAKGLNFGALEFYKIEAKNITPDRKFKVIQIVSCGLDVIYKRGKEDIPIKKPLLLCGPSRCHSPLAYIDIQIGSFDWAWRLFVGDEVCPSNLPITVDIKDKITGSTVRAYIENITRAAQAYFNFSFKLDDDEDRDDESCTISITRGKISATIIGSLPDKKKIAAKYAKLRPHQKFWEPLTERPAITLLSVGHSSKIQQLSAGENIHLNRSVIGLHFKFALQVSVDMTFIVEEPGKRERTGRVSGTVDLDVPMKPCKREIWFDQEGAKYPKVKMVIDWKNDTSPYY